MVRVLRSDKLRARGKPALLAVAVAIVVLGTACLAVEAIVQIHLNPGKPLTALDVVLILLISAPPLAFLLVGAGIISRRSGNTIAWLMCSIGLLYSIGVLTTDLTDYEHRIAHAHGAILVVPAVIGNVIWIPFLLSLAAILILFPTGRPSSRRWSKVLWSAIGIAGIFWLGLLLRPGRLSNVPVQNPIGLSFVPVFPDDAIFPLLLLLLVVSLGALGWRFWRSQGEERQQMKWFTYGGALVVLFFSVATAVQSLDLALVPYFVALTMMPVAIGTAILKYRLYDIDVLINRTLVYGSLSASLALIYIAGVISLQSLFRLVVGQSSELAVVISTLAIAALFQPLRRWIQAFIDRRFYRRKYDAARTLAAFQTRLRDEVDLDGLTGDLLEVIQDTMHPAHVSLWLREARTKV